MKKCPVCDSVFINKSKYHPNQKFCSIKCTKYYQGRNSRNLSTNINNPLKFFCLVCEKEFFQIHGNNKKFCSRNCKNLAASRKNKGNPIKGPRKFIKGTGYINYQGYKLLSMKHANSSKRGQILEHVFVMSEHIGRPLFKHETVHHKNGIRDDNRLENLELWSHSHPCGQRIEDKIKWCKEFLEQYGYDVIIKEKS